MKHLFYFLLVLTSLASCRSVKPDPKTEFASASSTASTPTLKQDTTTYRLPQPSGDTATVTVVTPSKTKVGRAIAKVFGRSKPVVVTRHGAIVLPRNNKKGSISVVTGSGSSTIATVGKKANAATGEDATTTTIGKSREQVVVGDSNMVSTAEKNSVTGNGNTTIKKPTLGQQIKDLPWKMIGIVAGLLVIWFYAAPFVSFLPSRTRLLGWLPGWKRNDNRQA